MSSIRKYKLTKRIPRSRILDKYEDVHGFWNQDIINDAILTSYFVGQCPSIKNKFPSVVIHRTWGSINTHSDCMAKSVFVFPIKFGKTTKLFVEEAVVKFERGYFYRFNDWLDHGIDNPNAASLILVTVSFE